MAIFALAFAQYLPLQTYYRQDVTVSVVSELPLLVLLFFVITVGFLAIFSATLKTDGGRIMATILAVFTLGQHFPRVMLGFSSVTNWLPPVFASWLVIALTLLIIWAFFWQIENQMARRRPQLIEPITTVVKLVAVVVLGFNVVVFVIYLVRHHQASAYRPPAVTADLGKAGDRDIYYFVFDRYASRESLQNNFNFDNREFVNWLKDQGFIVRDNAFSNYQFTAPSVASTLRMNYLTDVAQKLNGERSINYLPYEEIIRNAPVSSLLRQKGYEIYNFGGWWNVTRKQDQTINVLPSFEASFLGSKTILSELQTNTINQTFLAPTLRGGISVGDFEIAKFNSADPRELYLSQMSELTRFAKTNHAKPRFVFGHLLNPHPPYVFTDNGDQPGYSGDDNDSDLPRALKYTNQLQYTNRSMAELIKTIRVSSKKPPIIIIQADEGPYPIETRDDWISAPTDVLKLKYGILGAYYLPDVDANEVKSDLNSVNAFRVVLNQYFGAKFDYLPDCSFAFNEEEPFKFADVTKKLHASNADCGRFK